MPGAPCIAFETWDTENLDSLNLVEHPASFQTKATLPQAAVLAVNLIPRAFITASVVFKVGFPLALKDR